MASSVTFPSPTEVGPRDWGTEMLLLHAPEKYTMKMITMEKGRMGGLQYHHMKDEGGLMISGSMEIRYDDGKGELISRVVGRGDVFHFPAGSVHQAIAHTDCCYIEVSTPHFNDRVHVEQLYGIKKEEGGLPSTKLEEVEFC
jgi:quercetin dioxygenase-like cupin family protein